MAEYINSHVYQAFLEAGVDKNIAEAAAKSIPTRIDSPTKTEFEGLRSDVRILQSDVQKLQSDVQELRSDVHALDIRMVRAETTLKIHTWFLAANLAGVLGILAKLLVG